jgi:iron transport multicopper oxidase
MFNGITYQLPLVPSLFTALSMGDNATIQSIYGPMTNAFVLDFGSTVELSVFNGDAGLHPCE